MRDFNLDLHFHLRTHSETWIAVSITRFQWPDKFLSFQTFAMGGPRNTLDPRP
jgi:hypothetical protein